MTGLEAVRVIAFAGLGAVLGSAYLAALGWNVRLYLDSGAEWIAPVVHAVRALMIVASFTLCVHCGALALISSVVGFHVMRTLITSRQTLALAPNA